MEKRQDLHEQKAKVNHSVIIQGLLFTRQINIAITDVLPMLSSKDVTAANLDAQGLHNVPVLIIVHLQKNHVWVVCTDLAEL